jgi:hypothetical protein
MSSVKERASNAPPAPKELTTVLRWLEISVRKPLEGTWFDRWIATPAKEFYIGAKRLE